MPRNTLEKAMAAVSASWGALSSELVRTCQSEIEMLARAAPQEPWLAQLLAEKPESRELYRDPVHGFVLLAHFEMPGLYHAPHDHGRSWVVYAVQQGASEMGTYARVSDTAGRIKLIKRNTTLVTQGQAQIYLPGDIHDALCVSEPTLLLRFTATDLKHGELTEHRMIRYVQRDGEWTTGSR